jgi:hypothetical protein
MISNIYNSNRALYKIGERKGKTKVEIERIEELKLKPKKLNKNKTIILKENETIRGGKIVQIKDKKVLGAKRKKKSSKIFKQYKHLFR